MISLLAFFNGAVLTARIKPESRQIPWATLSLSTKLLSPVNSPRSSCNCARICIIQPLPLHPRVPIPFIFLVSVFSFSFSKSNQAISQYFSLAFFSPLCFFFFFLSNDSLTDKVKEVRRQVRCSRQVTSRSGEGSVLCATIVGLEGQEWLNSNGCLPRVNTTDSLFPPAFVFAKRRSILSLSLFHSSNFNSCFTCMEKRANARFPYETRDLRN